MNVGENSELKGNIEINSLYAPRLQGADFQTDAFREELTKILEGDTPDYAAFVPVQFDLLQNYTDSEEVETIKIETEKIDNKDAMFFLNIASNSTNMNLSIKDEAILTDANNYKTMEVSKTLADALIRASENNKALRFDFDNQVTVVMKISAQGKIDVSFFPKDKEVENYLKNNIDYLKIRFDEQSIAYSNISYKPYREQRNKKQGDKNE